jgi:outer membrane autotransporter protein
LANFLAGTQSGSGATIPGVNLIAGQEYSFLLLFQSGSNGIATFTLDGLGCISLGSNACADYVTQGNVLSNDPSVPAGNVLSALNAAGTSTGDMATVLNTFNAYSESQLNTEVRKLAPVNNNAPTLGALAASTSGLNTVSGRTAILRGDTQASAGETGLAAGDDPRKRAFWVKAFGSRSRQDKQDNFDGYQADAYGASFGADTEVANNLRVGGAFTYADTDIGQRDFRQGDGTNIDSYQLTAYGMKEYGAAYVDVMGAYSRHNYQSHRATALGRTANGEWNGDQFSLRLDGGYRLPLGNALLIPMASLEWSQLKQGSYTETGAGALNQANDSSRFNTLNAGLGARLSTQFDAGSSTITPDVHAMAYHNFGDRGLDSTSRFTGGGSSFTTPGLKIARDTYNLGVGVSVQPNKLAKVSLNYDFEGRSGFQGHAVQLTGRWDF